MTNASHTILPSGDPNTAFHHSTAADILDTYGPPRFLLSSSTKADKSNALRVLTKVLYLTPGIFCPAATPACRRSCLGHTSGKMGWEQCRIARDQRAALYLEQPNVFFDRLRHELTLLRKQAKRHNLLPAARLNGTSDILWERRHPEILAEFPAVQFYDYTKMRHRVVQCGKGSLGSKRWPANYHLTYSAALRSQDRAIDILHHGGNVAVVFWPELPKSWWGFSVLDGDKHDARFLDPKGTIVGLRAKGFACVDLDGFVIRPCPQCSTDDKQLTLVSTFDDTHRHTLHQCDACGFTLRARKMFHDPVVAPAPCS